MLKFMSFASHAISNLFHKPVTSGYPYVEREYTKRTRGHVNINIDDCLFCGICSKRCPADAIKVDRSSKTWKIDRMGCVQCSSCVNACPKHCLSMDGKYTEPNFENIVDEYNAPIEENAPSDAKQVSFSADSCVYCGLCAKKCPSGAITVDRASKTWEIRHDECVRCGACIAGCPKKSLSMTDAVTKPKKVNVVNSIDICVLCGMCARKCPAGAITVNRNEKTWTVNRDECVSCGACVDTCPKKCLSMDGTEKESGIYTQIKE